MKFCLGKDHFVLFDILNATFLDFESLVIQFHEKLKSPSVGVRASQV